MLLGYGFMKHGIPVAQRLITLVLGFLLCSLLAAIFRGCPPGHCR